MLFSAREILGALPSPVAVMVSGGIDSACLLHLAAQICRSVTAVHCNHRIRAEADRDEAFVRKEALALGVSFERYEADVPALSQEKGISLETAGREFRSGVIEALKKRGFTVCTAHHADDNAETVLMHLLRGSGIGGLCGMDVSASGVVRPFLECTRAQIEAYAAAAGVEYVTDATNADDAYTRNFIRNRVMPLLNERFAASSQLNRLARHAREARAFLEGSLDPEVLTVTGDTAAVKLCALTDARAHAYIRQAMEGLDAGEEVCTAAVDAVRALLDKQNGKKVSLAGGVTAVREYDRVTFYRPTGERPAPQPFALAAFPAFDVEFAACPPRPAPGCLRFDPDKVPAGAVVRTRRPGDRFKPFGSGTKSLKKYLIDKKVPARLRDRLPLVAYENTVYVVCGVGIGDAVKLDGKGRAAQCYTNVGE